MNSLSTDFKNLNCEKSVLYILNKLKKSGFQGYIAGGAVRDILLKKKPNDFDILTNASVDEILSIFSDQKVKKVGKTFPVCMVNNIEISSGRGKYNKNTFPQSDLSKRDFTINAMAYNLETKKVVDPFNGRKDLQNSIIKFVNNPDERIKEDPVRMIRACRFAAQINGQITPASFEAILNNRDLLDSSVADERIGKEIIKAMSLEKPSLFFKALKNCNLLSKIFPSLDRCYDLDGGPHHGETVFEHCMLVGDAISSAFPILRLAGFLHDVGKFDSAKIKEGEITFPAHEKETKAVMNDLGALKFSNTDMGYIKSLIKSHMRPLTPESTPKAVRRLLAMLRSYNLGYKDFMRMRIADKAGNLSKNPYTLLEIKTRLKKILIELSDQSGQSGQAVFSINQLKLTGNDIIKILELSPGPKVGQIKQILFEKVLDDPSLNSYDELKRLCLLLKIKK